MWFISRNQLGKFHHKLHSRFLSNPQCMPFIKDSHTGCSKTPQATTQCNDLARDQTRPLDPESRQTDTALPQYKFQDNKVSLRQVASLNSTKVDVTNLPFFQFDLSLPPSFTLQGRISEDIFIDDLLIKVNIHRVSLRNKELSY